MTCPECKGAGKVVYSCCGDNITGNDYDNCPTCKEHMGSTDPEDGEMCEYCEGKGSFELEETIYANQRGYNVTPDPCGYGWFMVAHKDWDLDDRRIAICHGQQKIKSTVDTLIEENENQIDHTGHGTHICFSDADQGL